MTITYEGGNTTPEIGVDIESLTITDATTGTLNVTGTNITGNISASFTDGTDDWSFTNNPLAAAGGSLGVNYTGRFLSATNNVELSATDATSVNVPVTYQPNLYVVGDYGDGNDWNFSTGTPMSYSNGSYTADITTTNNTYLLISKKVGDGAGWSNEQYLYGPVANGNNYTNWELQEGYLGGTHNLDLTNGVHHSIYIPQSMAGTYTITVTPPYGISFTRKLEQVATPTFSPAEGTFTEAQTVSISCATSGATIYYTTDGSTPTTASTQYTSAITLTATTTIKAIAVKSGWTDSEVATATYTKVEPSSDVTVCDGSDTNEYVPFYGYYNDVAGTKIQVIYPADKLADLDDKTITGVTFFTNSTGVQFYNGNITVTMGLTDDTQFSDYDEMKTISGTTVSTSFSPVRGGTEISLTFEPGLEYVTGKNLIIQTEVITKGSFGHTYFLGENQTYLSASNNKVYGDSYTKFLPKATFAYEGGLDPVATPTFSPAAGTYTSAQSVTIACATTGATITYSTDGGTTWTPYTTPITVSETTTIMAKAEKDGMATSEASAEYVINIPQVATPTFSPAAGTYTSAQSVTIACEIAGATIYYTTDGSTPTTSSSVYSAAINVSEDMTIKAIAVVNGMTNSEVATAEYVINIPQPYNVTVNPDGGTIDFGTVVYNEGTSTRTIMVTNTGLNAITPTLSALTAPYSTDYVAAALASGESVTITITFAPTEEGTFTDNATLTFGRGTETRNFTLTGKGAKYDANDHSALYDYEYTWTDDEGTPHTSNLLETATDANQIIAMLRKIYMTPEIPGNKKRGYTREGAVENWRVSYPAVGQLTRTYTSGSGYSYEYTDAYGWNIPTEKPILNTSLGSYNYYYLDPTEYEPIDEGVTLIMIELKDLTNFSGNSNYYSISSNSLSLKEKFANAFKSARIITNWKQSGTGEEAGTLFKIDADKLNRFFLIAKGQLRLIDHTYGNFQDGYTFSEPSYRIRNNSSSGAYTDTYFTEAVMYPFIHMFEQFSPNVASTASNAQTDEYQKLINMESFYVIHDCPSAAFITGNHEFNMYGLDSESEDCQDVRDMMFFVPEYRMMDWGEQYAVTDKRDLSSEKFVNYHQSHQPKMGLYVIRQNEITGEQQANAEVYDLNLSWESNLLDFLPGDEAEYDLYRVVIDPNTGEKTYDFVATIPSGQTTYVDHVAMQENGQMVTYVVQGQDTEHFLSLQMSNEESYIIPGLDPDELMTLSPKFEHYARFEPETETNYYANQLKVSNAVGAYIKESFLESTGAQFTFYRSYTDDNNVEQTVPIFTAKKGSGNVLNITEQNQRAANTYHKKGVDWIKMTNPSTVSYTVDGNGNVTFQDFNLYDNIAVSVADNNHPGRYSYKVELTYTDGGEQKTAHSNKIGVVIHKTSLDLKAYNEQQVIDDTDHQLPLNQGMFDIALKYSSKTEILRYDAYRWTENEDKDIIDFDDANTTFNPSTGDINEQDIAPNGIAGNQGTFYTVKMNAVDQGQVTVNQTGTTMATFVDDYAAQNPDNYFYAPVIETFTGRDDYNTYGAPLQETNVTGIDVEVGNYIMANNEGAAWTDNGKTYTYYTVELKLTRIDNMPEDYDLYKVRVWRKVNRDLLNEKPYNANLKHQYRGHRLNDNGEYLMEEVNYNIFSKNTTPEQYQLGQGPIEPTTVYNGQTLNLSPGSYEVRATFGAQKLREKTEETGVIDELPMQFIVRAYYTNVANIDQYNLSNRAPRRDGETEGDGKYYIAEETYDFTFESQDLNQHTSLTSVVVNREVTGVTYYNVMGQQSSKPFDGLNIVVTSYSDGTTSTAKVIK